MVNKLSKAQKKTAMIVAGVAAALVVLLIAGITVVAQTNMGKSAVENAHSEFKPIEMPEDSSQLTAVQDAPVGRKDKDDDPHIAVDLRGKKVNRTTPSQESSPHRRTTTDHPDRQPTAKDMKQVSNIGKRVIARSVGANFALGALDEPASGVIEPTNFTSMFWVRNRGVHYTKTNQGTTYLAAHALDLNDEGNALSGIAPGNFFYDPFTKQAKIKKGDIMTVGGVKFKFDTAKRAGKGLIARDKDVWNEKKKNRLILITCLNNSNDNMVFFFDKA